MTTTPAPARAGYRTPAGVVAAADGLLIDVAEGYVTLAEARSYRSDLLQMLRATVSDGAAEAFTPALRAAANAWKYSGTKHGARRAFVEDEMAAHWLRILRIHLRSDSDWTGR